MTVLSAESLEVQTSEQHVASGYTGSVGRTHGRQRHGESRPQYVGYDTEPLLADWLTIQYNAENHTLEYRVNKIA